MSENIKPFKKVGAETRKIIKKAQKQSREAYRSSMTTEINIKAAFKVYGNKVTELEDISNL